MLSLNDVNNYIQYCSSIEQNLKDTISYVEVCDSNDSTYSFEYAKIIMLACSEIDVLCRLLCKEVDPLTDFDKSATHSGNIRCYANLILQRFPKLPSFELFNIKKRCTISPFNEWTLNPSYSSPSWWDDYQKIKHYRHVEYSRATQVNAFSSVAGLITLNLYLHRLISNKPYSIPPYSSELFHSNVFNLVVYADAAEDLPDFL